MKADLEKITKFRCDKNAGPPINPSAESIAFKFCKLEETEKEAIEEIISLLKEHKKSW
jgi:hypothetical protein